MTNTHLSSLVELHLGAFTPSVWCWWYLGWCKRRTWTLMWTKQAGASLLVWTPWTNHRSVPLYVRSLWLKNIFSSWWTRNAPKSGPAADKPGLRTKWETAASLDYLITSVLRCFVWSNMNRTWQCSMVNDIWFETGSATNTTNNQTTFPTQDLCLQFMDLLSLCHPQYDSETTTLGVNLPWTSEREV